MTGIYGGDGEQLSLRATFPQLRAIELEYGSVLRGLPIPTPGKTPPFLSLRGGMDELVGALRADLERTQVLVGRAAARVSRGGTGLSVELTDGEPLAAEGVLIATPAFVTAELLAELTPSSPRLMPRSRTRRRPSSRSGIRQPTSRRSTDNGYVVPRAEGSDVLACTWSSQKWEHRAPEESVLLRVYVGRFGGRDVTTDTDDGLVALARDEIAFLGVSAAPLLTLVHRWPLGMPQYVLGHLDRLVRIEAALAAHPGLALAGAAYRGVGSGLHCVRGGGGRVGRAHARPGGRVSRDTSERLFAEATRLLPGGVSSPVRAFKAVGGSPLFIERGEGAYLVDVDGNRYVDYVLSWGPLILVTRIRASSPRSRRLSARGRAFWRPEPARARARPTGARGDAERRLVRFVSSGTEATMSACGWLAASPDADDREVRGLLSRPRDALLVKAGSGARRTGGRIRRVPAAFADHDHAAVQRCRRVEAVFNRHEEIAAVIVEPVPATGIVFARARLSRGSSRTLHAAGALLIFDEVMTGFRLASGGCTGALRYHARPHALGKVIGGGLPVGAFGGRARSWISFRPTGPVYQAGTLRAIRSRWPPGSRR